MDWEWPSGYIYSQQNVNLWASTMLVHHLEAIPPLPGTRALVAVIYFYVHILFIIKEPPLGLNIGPHGFAFCCPKMDWEWPSGYIFSTNVVKN
jgi:hypothetical protein